MVEQSAPADEIRRRGIARRALGGQALTGWWADDWKAARSAAANGGWAGRTQDRRRACVVREALRRPVPGPR